MIGWIIGLLVVGIVALNWNSSTYATEVAGSTVDSSSVKAASEPALSSKTFSTLGSRSPLPASSKLSTTSTKSATPMASKLGIIPNSEDGFEALGDEKSYRAAGVMTLNHAKNIKVSTERENVKIFIDKKGSVYFNKLVNAHIVTRDEYGQIHIEQPLSFQWGDTFNYNTSFVPEYPIRTTPQGYIASTSQLATYQIHDHKDNITSYYDYGMLGKIPFFSY